MRRKRQEGSALGPLHELMMLMGGMQQLGANQQELGMKQRAQESDLQAAAFKLKQDQANHPFQMMANRLGTVKGLGELQSTVPGFNVLMDDNEQELNELGISRELFPMLDDQQYMQIIAHLFSDKKKKPLDPKLQAPLMRDQSIQARALRELLAGAQK